MRRREVGILAVAALCALATLPAAAQHKSLKEQVVGTWHIVSVEEVYSDGHKETPWGPNMKGAVSFAPQGKVLLMIIGADLPTPSGKPQEAARLVVAYFGTYSVDEGAKTITYTAERATIPAFDGLARKATVTVTGEELRQSSAPVTRDRPARDVHAPACHEARALASLPAAVPVQTVPVLYPGPVPALLHGGATLVEKPSLF